MIRAWAWFGAIALVLCVEVVRTAPATPPPVLNEGHGDYVYVPAGPFKMGDNFGDGEERERPVHVVEVDGFYIGKYEMTNREWRAFREDPGYEDAKFWPGGRVMPKDQISYWTNARQHGGGTPNGDNYPVQGVNWDGAVAYCNWLSAKTGKKYRLPTEAEWEKAARGTDQRKYPWGSTIDHSYANFTGGFDFGVVPGFYDGSKRADLQTHSNASPYNAFDMAGNVMDGAPTGTVAIITRSRRGRIRKVRTAARIEWCAAVVSISTLPTFEPIRGRPRGLRSWRIA